MKTRQNAKKKPDPIPDILLSAEEAGEFWDTHSTGDYEDHLIPVDMTINIKRRHFEIEIDRESFMALNAYSKKVNKPVYMLASSILKEKLISPSPLG